jgi:hypothetical protein
MTIIDAKEWASWPVIYLSVRWFQNVQNNWDSIFIVSPDKTLISVGSISSDYSIPLERMFSRFVIWDDNFMSRLEGHDILRVNVKHTLWITTCWRFFIINSRSIIWLRFLVLGKDSSLLASISGWMTGKFIDFDITCTGIGCWLTTWMNYITDSRSYWMISSFNLLFNNLSFLTSTIISWWWWYRYLKILSFV